MAVVIKQFKGTYDGENICRVFNVGDVIPEGSDLERVAIEQGWCKAKPEHLNKMELPPKNKARSGSASPAGRASLRKTLKRLKAKT